jgi:predicted O-linked N-acetylglucosamine transferase (SPINDLY family)
LKSQKKIFLDLALRAHSTGDAASASTYYKNVLDLDPNCFLALGWLGTIEAQRKNFTVARSLLEKALAKNAHPDFLFNYANTLQETFCYEQAKDSYLKAIEQKKDPLFFLNLSACCNKLKHSDQGLHFANQALAISQNYAEAWSNRGNALNDLRRHEEALASYEKSIALKPDYAEAWSNRGNALNDLRRHEEALASYEKSIALKPEAGFALWHLAYSQMKLFDWTDLAGRLQRLKTKIIKQESASEPFIALSLFDEPELQRQCAEIYSKHRLNPPLSLGLIPRDIKEQRLRIGYFSMDFREHPVSHLIVDLIENHDRNNYEIYGFSFGINTNDRIRQRLEKAFDKFFDVKDLSELAIARLSREQKIDIAIDLGGYTQDSRPKIFAHRAAPIQINYLGYPGTMGHKSFDYFIGDRTTITSENLEHFSEKIIFMPHSFQVNPSQRPIGKKESSKETYGLPNKRFVFCCFNNTWKINHNMFERWVRILQLAPNSILWLSADDALARKNARRSFEERGLARERLIFSARVTRDSYLDQYRFADLFLDTLPYNAGTTASDALWMGLPVLTLAGKSFAGRMAASLLTNVGIAELIAYDTREYEEVAIKLATNPSRLAAIRSRLVRNRSTAALFDIRLFTRNLESAYQAAYGRYRAGLTPDHIHVNPGDSP